ncbi:hypothetical protein [Arthrobacter sp. UYEF21]|uniref:hypothetical protein n=1 Tax=Arthrobacter sp. UYEF21 TaxID=1756364 RepID=UPI0033983618
MGKSAGAATGDLPFAAAAKSARLTLRRRPRRGPQMRELTGRELTRPGELRRRRVQAAVRNRTGVLQRRARQRPTAAPPGTQQAAPTAAVTRKAKLPGKAAILAEGQAATALTSSKMQASP